MITIQPVVVAHPDREWRARQLAYELGAGIAVDDLGEGEWANHRSALLLGAQSGASHVLCIEDDAVPVPNLLAEAAKAIEARPNACISLYVGTGRPRQIGVRQAIERADALDLSWLSADSLCWGVAFIMPAQDIDPMLGWAKTSRLPTDQRIGAWYRSQQRPVYYTWPSLVDHADIPSVIKGRPRPEKRVAHRVGTRESYGGASAIIERIG